MLCKMRYEPEHEVTRQVQLAFPVRPHEINQIGSASLLITPACCQLLL